MKRQPRILSHCGLRGLTLSRTSKQMAKHCPKCGSSRIRRGYGHERFPLRLICVRRLLCDHCNLQFRSFVLPGTLPRSRHNKKKSSNQAAQATGNVPDPGPAERHTGTASASRQCARCQGNKIRRSRRRGIWERVISLVGVYPYRCHDCDHRFFALKRKSQA